MKPLTLSNIIQLKKNYPGAYEDLAKLQDHINAITAPAPLPPVVTPASFSLSAGMGIGAVVSAVSGTVASGKVTVKIGSAPAPNPTFMLNFPPKAFVGIPLATIVKSGGTGALPISYNETAAGITVTLIGTPTASTTYTFNFTVTN